MAGTPKGSPVVDVVAALDVQQPEPPTEPAVSLELPAEVPTQVAPAGQITAAKVPIASATGCPFGHSNPEGARFCGECGTPTGAQAPLAARVQAGPPKPESQLSPEERAERERRHAEALAAAAALDRRPDQIVASTGPATTVHFVKDGFTAFGSVWYRGQEVIIGPDHPRWQDARRWLFMDDAAQMATYGDVYFRPGPWPGQRGYAGAQWERREGATPPAPEELARAEEAERRRAGGVPAAIG